MSAIDKNFRFLIRRDRRPSDIVVAEPGGHLPEQAGRDTFDESDTGWLWDTARNEL